uniref:Phosphoglycerate mutase n=1 Tax=Vannella robusta TaxID=1487602 RepID=A0A7S4MME9_9EUKA|mmetsp:Transcript_307/g.391  ORF Transcript_307/g.391 Transcript_307/m.391 type:complete len:499 (+) Transcript_307:64-1560(+)
MQEQWISSLGFSSLCGVSTNQLKHDGKQLFVIRHGQSEANIQEYTKDRATNPIFRDAALTDFGIEQARELQNTVCHWDIDLFLVSPLTRTMQTFCHVFENYPNIDQIPITVAPVVSEFYVSHQECMGRPSSELLSDNRLKSLKLFPRLQESVSLLHDDWWVDGDDSKRLSHLSHLLHHVQARNICIVAHWGFTHSLFSQCPGKATKYSPDNCDWIYSIWNRIGDAYKQNPNGLDLSSDLGYYLLWLHRTHDRYSLPNRAEGRLQESAKFSKEKRFAVCLLPGGNQSRNGLLNEIMKLQEMFSSEFAVTEQQKWFYVPLTKFVAIQSAEQLNKLILCLWEVRETIVKHKVVWRVSSEHVKLFIEKSNSSGNVTSISFGFDSLSIRKYCLQRLSNEFGTILGEDDFHPKPLCSSSEPSSFEGDYVFRAPVISLQDNSDQEQFLKENLESSPCLHGAVTGHVNYGWDYLFKKIKWRLVLCSQTSSDPTGFQIEPNISFPLW